MNKDNVEEFVQKMRSPFKEPQKLVAAIKKTPRFTGITDGVLSVVASIHTAFLSVFKDGIDGDAIEDKKDEFLAAVGKTAEVQSILYLVPMVAGICELSARCRRMEAMQLKVAGACFKLKNLTPADLDAPEMVELLKDVLSEVAEAFNPEGGIAKAYDNLLGKDSEGAPSKEQLDFVSKKLSEKPDDMSFEEAFRQATEEAKKIPKMHPFKEVKGIQLDAEHPETWEAALTEAGVPKHIQVMMIAQLKNETEKAGIKPKGSGINLGDRHGSN